MHKTTIITTLAIVAISCSAFCVGCGGEQPASEDKSGIVALSFATEDGVAIFADYTQPEGANKAVILVHDKGGNRGAWNDLAAKLNDAGYAVLAMDLRGHGKSVQQGEKTLDYKDFSDTWTGDEGKTWMMDCYKDVEAGVRFLESKGFTKANIAAIGAGEGADVLTQYRGQNPVEDRVMAFVLLSPELRDYSSTIKNVSSILDETIFFYYCNNDTECGAYDGNDNYKKMSDVAAEYKSQLRQKMVARRHEGAEHGVAMLNLEGVANKIIEDLDSLLD